MTTRLALLTLAVVAAAAHAAVSRLGRLLSDDLKALGRRLDETEATRDRWSEALDQRLRATEQAAARADETGRSVSRQVVELNRLTVDQAMTLVDVRDHLVKRLPAPDHRSGHGSSAESNGGTA